MYKQIGGIWVYVPEHFALREVLPIEMEEAIMLYGELNWLHMDPRVLITNDRLRKRYGTAVMNPKFYTESVRSPKMN